MNHHNLSLPFHIHPKASLVLDPLLIQIRILLFLLRRSD